MTSRPNTSECEAKKPSDTILKQRFYHKAIQLEQKTRFSCIEVEALLRIFDKIVEKYKSPMTKAVFKDVLFNFFGFTSDIMMEHIFRAMTSGKSVMTHDDWILGMDIYLRGSLSQMANFAFTVYDQQKRDMLSKDDVQTYLRDILVEQVAEEDSAECHTDMLDMAFVLLDRDKDGYISRKDFVKSVMTEPLCLHVLGECVPPLNTALTLDALIKQGDAQCLWS